MDAKQTENAGSLFKTTRRGAGGGEEVPLKVIESFSLLSVSQTEITQFVCHSSGMHVCFVLIRTVEVLHEINSTVFNALRLMHMLYQHFLP